MVTMLLGLVSPSTMEGGPSSSGLVKRLIGYRIIMKIIVTMIIIIWSNFYNLYIIGRFCVFVCHEK